MSNNQQNTDKQNNQSKIDRVFIELEKLAELLRKKYLNNEELPDETHT